MKAVLCKSFGPPESLVIEEVSDLRPGKGQAVIAVKACSVNFPDTLMIQGLYQFKPPFPFSPGSDVSGVVKSIGEGVKNLKVGDEVFALVGHGGFAEEVLADARVTFPKPPGMSFEESAAFTMVYGTSYHALKDRAQLKEGETLVVLGAAGGVGLTAVELGKVMGAKVIACASTDEKLQLCKKYGADEVVNYSEGKLKDQLKELTAGKGADVVYDPVGGSYTEAALRATGWKGRYLVVGFAAGDIPKIPLNLPLLKGCDIRGVFWGAFTQKDPGANMANIMQLMQWYQEGKIKPFISKKYSLEEVPIALNAIMNREVKGKVVVVP
ncbi:MAG: NADPH:quinone oxidoreductase family protein [Saprospiraceae bacterium]|nr:NADPH:quinone oxidoreductase family protein [Saprospiraceae bacterium]